MINRLHDNHLESWIGERKYKLNPKLLGSTGFINNKLLKLDPTNKKKITLVKEDGMYSAFIWFW